MITNILTIIGILGALSLICWLKPERKLKDDVIVVGRFLDGKWKFTLEEKEKEEYGLTQKSIRQL